MRVTDNSMNNAIDSFAQDCQRMDAEITTLKAENAALQKRLDATVKCDVCGTQDADLFPGWTREMDE